jgi:hypothetical protein
MVNLVHRGKPLDGWCNLGRPAYPHVHRKAEDGAGRELMKVDVEVPEDIHNNRVKAKSKPGVQ